MFKKSFYFAFAIIFVLGLSISIQSLLAAWTAPTQTAPNCPAGAPACDAPINTGNGNQQKGGSLILGNAGNALLVPGGSVGIGTNNPAGKLNVKSAGVSTYPFIVHASDGGRMGYLWEDAGQHTIFDLFNGTDANNVRLNTNGNSWILNSNVGIGTNNPSSKLSIVAPNNNGITLTPASVNDQPRIHFSTSHGVGGIIQKYNPNTFDVYGDVNTPISFSPGNSEKMRITAGGDVGIGTTDPQTRLDVDGQIKSRSGGFVFPDGTVQTTAAGGLNTTALDLYTHANYTYEYTGSAVPLYLTMRMRTYGGNNGRGSVEARWLAADNSVIKNWKELSGTNVNAGVDGGSGMADSELATVPFIAGTKKIQFRAAGTNAANSYLDFMAIVEMTGGSGSGVADWNTMINKPAGFADNIDDVGAGSAKTMLEVGSVDDQTTWHCVGPVNLQDQCGDEDGCTIRLMLQHETDGSDQFRIIDEFIGMEQPAYSFNRRIGRYGWTRQSGGGDYSWISGDPTWRGQMYSPWDWTWMHNYKHDYCNGGVPGPAEAEYKFWFMSHPHVMTRAVIID